MRTGISWSVSPRLGVEVLSVLSCHAGPVNGSDLAQRYYESIVAPLLAEFDGEVAHAAGRLGQGSDVLGFDDAMSRDHDWGLRLTVLVEATHVSPVAEFIESRLPGEYLGYPTRFAVAHDGEMRHRIDIDTAQQFSIGLLGVDVTSRLSVPEWLSLSGQSILELTAGPLFADTVGTITTIRDQLRWYPDNLWRYVVATSWARLAEELPLLGRAGIRGDELGSSVIGAWRSSRIGRHGAWVSTRAELGAVPQVVRLSFPSTPQRVRVRPCAQSRNERGNVARPPNPHSRRVRTALRTSAYHRTPYRRLSGSGSV